MSLPTVDLDDRTFDDLFAQARSLVPAHAPEWTNHNLSDPGITLIELFAWLAEMLIYRTNQVPETHRMAFLRLLRGPEWRPTADLDTEVRDALAELRRMHRAVTVEDYAALAKEASPNVARVRVVARRNLRTGRNVETPGDVSVIVVRGVRPSVLVQDADGRLLDMTNQARTEYGPSFGLAADPGQDLFVGSPEVFQGIDFALASPGSGYALTFAYWNGKEWAQLGEAHELHDGTDEWRQDGTVEFAAREDWVQNEVADVRRYWVRVSTARSPSRVAQARQVEPDDRLLQRVDEHLEQRRILGTSHHVLAPESIPVTADIVVVRRSDVLDPDARASVVAAIERFLDPLTGGPDGDGWPFGRRVYVSELHELLRALSEVDHVADLRLSAAPSSGWLRAEEIWHESGEQVGVDIGANRLPEADLDPARILTVARSLGIRVRTAVAPLETASHAAVTRAVKDAVRAFFHPQSPPAPRYRPLAEAVLAPGTLRGPVEEALAGLGSLRSLELESNPERMARDEVLDVVTVRIEEGELVEPVTTVSFVE